MPDYDNYYAHAHLAARKITLAIESLNLSIREGKALGVHVTMFTEDDPVLAVPRIVADIAVLHARVRGVVDRREVLLDADPALEKEEETSCRKQ